MTEHKIGTREEWETARQELLERENEHAQRSEELARERRAMLEEPPATRHDEYE